MKVLILGAGPAGLTVAETLREHDAASEIVMLSAEPFPPYSPPAMVDYFASGRDETLFWRGRDVCDRLGVEYRSGVRAGALLPTSREVELEDGSRIGYHRLVIATGSHLYAPVEGHDLPGVYDFKSLSAAESLVARVRALGGGHALVVGAGFIGVEVALLLRELDVEVSLVEMLDRVMPRTLDEETAAVVRAEMERRGIEVRLDTKAEAFVGADRAEALRLSSGEVLEADVFVAATGVKPNVDFLQGSGLDLGWGVRVNDHLQTDLPGVYAAGDVAETVDRMTGERFVHAIFPNAVAQGRAVAHHLLGFDAPYEGAESMNSLKHLGVPVMAVGAGSGEQELRWRRGEVLRKVFLDGGRIVGFRLAGDVRGAGVYRSLMLRHADVSRFGSRLAEPCFGTAALMPTAVA